MAALPHPGEDREKRLLQLAIIRLAAGVIQ